MIAVSERAFAAITQETLTEYAHASRDMNPIHLREEAAKVAGLPGVIAHGMLIASYISERAVNGVLRDGKPARSTVKKLNVRFRAKTFLGDVVTISGAARSGEGEVADGLTVIDLAAKNQRGETVATGVARVSLT